MVTTSSEGGKFKLQPLKEKSDDVVEVGLRPEGQEKQFFFQTSVLDKMQKVEWVLDAFKEGNRILLLDIRPLKSNKSKVDELRRAIDRLKLQVEKTGRLGPVEKDGNWLLLVPKDVEFVNALVE
jgi:hypothetical protein